MDIVSEVLHEMLLEATLALSHLDAEALETLERRASALRDSLGRGPVRVAGEPRRPELQTRLDIFSDVVTATSRNLAMLRRTCVQEQGQAQYLPEGDLRWAR